MAYIRPIKDNILFQFHEGYSVSKGKLFFEEKVGPLIIPRIYEMSVKAPRWGTVIAVGPDVKDGIKVGTNILIEPLMWTHGVPFENKTYWRTNNKSVMAIRD